MGKSPSEKRPFIAISFEVQFKELLEKMSAGMSYMEKL
jgi:hypothetical protein